MLGANLKWVVNSRTWGERGVVKEGNGKKPVDRDIPMMFVGYPENRESICPHVESRYKRRCDYSRCHMDE